jgi:hypothetical protein
LEFSQRPDGKLSASGKRRESTLEFEGRSVSLPKRHWQILESIQESLADPSLSATMKRILDAWLIEHGFFEKEIGDAKNLIARKALDIRKDQGP